MKRTTQINAAFRRVFKGNTNIMTPDRVKRGNMVWEISTGTGFGGEPLYGVSVIELPATYRRDLSAVFGALGAASSYIDAGFTDAE